MLGNMMASGATPSMAWTNHPLLFFFQMTYIVLVFLIMLNFIIAIVVEAYMLVKNEMEDKKTEQSFWQDAAAIVVAASKRRVYGWPAHPMLIEHLSKYKQGMVDYAAIRHLFPSWRRLASMRAWLNHYGYVDGGALSRPRATSRQG